MKKLLFTILFVLTVFAASAQNSDEQYIDGVRYELVYIYGEPTHVEVRAESGSGPAYDVNSWNPPATLEIPETVEFDGKSYPVTIICQGAFSGIANLDVNFVLPKTITKIEDEAFYVGTVSGTPSHTIEFKSMSAPVFDLYYLSTDYFSKIIVPEYSVGYDTWASYITVEGDYFTVDDQAFVNLLSYFDKQFDGTPDFLIPDAYKTIDMGNGYTLAITGAESDVYNVGPQLDVRIFYDLKKDGDVVNPDLSYVYQYIGQITPGELTLTADNLLIDKSAKYYPAFDGNGDMYVVIPVPYTKDFFNLRFPFKVLKSDQVWAKIPRVGGTLDDEYVSVPAKISPKVIDGKPYIHIDVDNTQLLSDVTCSRGGYSINSSSQYYDKVSDASQSIDIPIEEADHGYYYDLSQFDDLVVQAVDCPNSGITTNYEVVIPGKNVYNFYNASFAVADANRTKFYDGTTDVKASDRTPMPTKVKFYLSYNLNAGVIEGSWDWFKNNQNISDYTDQYYNAPVYEVDVDAVWQYVSSDADANVDIVFSSIGYKTEGKSTAEIEKIKFYWSLLGNEISKDGYSIPGHIDPIQIDDATKAEIKTQLQKLVEPLKEKTYDGTSNLNIPDNTTITVAGAGAGGEDIVFDVLNNSCMYYSTEATGVPSLESAPGDYSMAASVELQSTNYYFEDKGAAAEPARYDYTYGVMDIGDGSITPRTITPNISNITVTKAYDGGKDAMNADAIKNASPAPASGEVLQGEEVTITIKSAEFDYPTVNEASKVTVKFELEGKDKDNYQIADIELDGEITPYIIKDFDITNYYQSDKPYDGNSGVILKNVDENNRFSLTSDNFPDSKTPITFEILAVNYLDANGYGVTVPGDYTFNIKVTPYSNNNYALENNGEFPGSGSISAQEVSVADFINAFKRQFTTLGKTYDGTTAFNGLNTQTDNIVAVALQGGGSAEFKITSAEYSNKNAHVTNSLIVECEPYTGSEGYSVSSPVTITGDDIVITPYSLENLGKPVEEYVTEDYYEKDRYYEANNIGVTIKKSVMTLPGVTVSGIRENVQVTLSEAEYSKNGEAICAIGNGYTITAILSLPEDGNYCFAKDLATGGYVCEKRSAIGTGSILGEPLMTVNKNIFEVDAPVEIGKDLWAKVSYGDIDSLPGVLTYTLASGDVVTELDAGAHTLYVHFKPSDEYNYVKEFDDDFKITVTIKSHDVVQIPDEKLAEALKTAYFYDMEYPQKCYDGTTKVPAFEADPDKLLIITLDDNLNKVYVTVKSAAFGTKNSTVPNPDRKNPEPTTVTFECESQDPGYSVTSPIILSGAHITPRDIYLERVHDRILSILNADRMYDGKSDVYFKDPDVTSIIWNDKNDLPDAELHVDEDVEVFFEDVYYWDDGTDGRRSEAGEHLIAFGNVYVTDYNYCFGRHDDLKFFFDGPYYPRNLFGNIQAKITLTESPQQYDDPEYCIKGEGNVKISFSETIPANAKFYKMSFESSSLKEQCGMIDEEGFLPINVDSKVSPGVYQGTITFVEDTIAKTPISNTVDFEITIRLPNDIVKYLYSDVLFADNHEDLFIAYQWLSANGDDIPGATRQFYHSDNLQGVYVRVTTKNGASLVACPAKASSTAKRALATVKVYPNPAKADIPFTLELVGGGTDYSDTEILIYSNTGTLVRRISDVEKTVRLSLPRGNYSGALVSHGEKLGFKIIVE